MALWLVVGRLEADLRGLTENFGKGRVSLSMVLTASAGNLGEAYCMNVAAWWNVSSRRRGDVTVG